MSRIGLAQLRERFERHGFRPTRARGQNFLFDPNLCEAIARLGELDASCAVVEIGTGSGYLTGALARRAGHVLTVEIEPKLAAIAKEELAEAKNIEFYLGDCLSGRSLDPKLAERIRALAPKAVVANLPYSIAGTVMVEFARFTPEISRLVFLIQDEVAQRAAAPPGGSARGPLTLFLQRFYDVRIAKRVSPSVFWPRPEVDSAVIVCERVRGRGSDAFEQAFAFWVDRAFQQRRKQIRRLCEEKWPGRASSILAECGIEPSARPQELSLENWLGLAKLTNC